MKKPTPKSGKKGKHIKMERKVKLEKDIKVELSTAKRPRALSAETPPAKRSNTITRRQAKAMEESDNMPENDDDEFPLLKDIIESAEGSESEDPRDDYLL